MSLPGWYPDPGHAPGRFRYWDGQAWSTTTTDHPGDPAPTAGRGADSATAPPRRSRRRRAPLLIALAVGLVMVIVVALAVRAVLDVPPGSVAPPPPAPTSTLPSPEPAPTSLPPSESPTEPGTPTPDTSTQPAECLLGDPSFRQPHPSDGRVHGGGLSFPKTADFIPTVQQSYFSWAYDVGGQDRAVAENWYSTYVVGALSTVDGFQTPKQAAELVLECTVSSGLYKGFTGRVDVASRATSVDHRKGWAIRSEVRVDDPDVTVAGDTVVVVVIDTGSPESLAMFWACVPLGDTAALKQLETVVRQLKVE